LQHVILAGLILALLAGCEAPTRLEPDPTGASDSWFLEVEGEGGTWLGPEELQAMGLDPNTVSSPVLRLSWDGQGIPHLPQESGDGWGVFFFAPDRSPRTSRRTAIHLDAGSSGQVMQARGSDGEGTEGCGDGLYTARWERDERYLPQGETETPWFWKPLRTPGSVTETVVLTGALSGPLTVTVELWSHTTAKADPDHRLVLGWDGQTVGSWSWDGLGMQRLTAAFTLPEGVGEEHRLTLETPALPGAEIALAWLDGWTVSYRRGVTATGGVWRAEGASMRVEQAGAGARAVDVTDPFGPVDMGPVAGGDCLATIPGHRYWVGVPAEAPGLALIRPARAVDVDALQEVRYLALAPAPLHDALQPLLEHREAQGLEAAVIEPQAVYDGLGTGQPEAKAVQALVQQLPELRYLLLVGDGTAEPGGSDGETGAFRVVSPFTRTKTLGEVPADSLLTLNKTGRPMVAVGRFPAGSVDETRSMVAKTMAWEETEGPRATLLLSDDEAEFERMADEMAELLPPGAAVERLDAGDQGSRGDLLVALNDGPAWLNYTGHGSLTLLCDEKLLTLEDADGWETPALVTAWTCLAAHYVHPTKDSMAEVWMRAPQGGAVAFLGPVGETTSSEQRPFVQAFYQGLQEDGRLGDAWLAAVREGRSDDVRWGYVLLGDPALRLTFR
jgi:hypothetical protein